MNQQSSDQQPANQSEMSTAVKVAIITGIFTIVGSIITGIVAPIIVARLSSRPTPTPTSAVATSTTVATQNPYPPFGGTLALTDPLSDNGKGYNWDTKPTSIGTCSFTEETYHAVALSSGTIKRCAAQIAIFLVTSLMK